MATKKKKSKPVGMKLTDKGFYKTIASIGGSTTKKRHGKEHYRRIAELSHAARRANRDAKAKPSPAK